MRHVFPACLSLLLVAVLAPAAPAHGQTVSLNRGGEEVTIAVGSAAMLPADFPDDILVPPAARLVRVEQPGDGRLLLDFTVAGTPQATADTYAAAMAVSGWTRAVVAPVDGAQVQAWEKAARAVLVVASAQGDGSHLRLQLLPRRAGPTDATRR